MRKFYLKAEGFDEKEVSKEDWIKAERRSGFRPPMASTEDRYMKVCATGGFTCGGVSGRIKTVSELECPECGAIIDVYYNEEYSIVECHNCQSDLECTWTELIKS